MIPFVNRQEISGRLPVIFPIGTPNRNYCIRDTAAMVIFTMLYIDAVEGSTIYLAPVDIYRMTEEQANRDDEDSRRVYAGLSAKDKSGLTGKRLYADNSREPIRD
jgi:hypothetical protein